MNMSQKTLQFVLGQLREKEQAAAINFSKAQQQLLQFQQQLNQLLEYRRSYIDRSLSQGIDGLRAEGFHRYQVFVKKLEEAQVQQQQSVAKLQHNVNHQRNVWISAQQRRQSIEKLIEKKQQQDQKLQMKAEQKLLDEYALFAYLRAQSS
jgi:flagellar FliJ protein